MDRKTIIGLVQGIIIGLREVIIIGFSATNRHWIWCRSSGDGGHVYVERVVVCLHLLFVGVESGGE